MTYILRDLPFHEVETTAVVPDGTAAIRAYQIVVWVSVTPQDVVELPRDTPRFPAILDTGNNHNFSLKREHLAAWSGAAESSLFERGQVQIGTATLPLVGANVWLHRNRAGQRDALTTRRPFMLELPEGIAVYPTGAAAAVRLPTLGLRALVRNRLHLVIDGKKLRVSLKAPGRS